MIASSHTFVRHTFVYYVCVLSTFVVLDDGLLTHFASSYTFVGHTQLIAFGRTALEWRSGHYRAPAQQMVVSWS